MVDSDYHLSRGIFSLGQLLLQLRDFLGGLTLLFKEEAVGVAEVALDAAVVHLASQK